MKVTCEMNGTLRLRLEPQNALELAFMLEAATRSDKGTTTILALPANNGTEFILEVGEK